MNGRQHDRREKKLSPIVYSEDYKFVSSVSHYVTHHWISTRIFY